MKKIIPLLLLVLLSTHCAYDDSPHNQMCPGPYQPTWKSLSQWNQAPEWFEDAKFGIWVHFGPQNQPAQGDWYARYLYIQDSPQYRYHTRHYGHPSESGFIDVIASWKAENWHPDSLVALFKDTGARYFIALGNHHDNFDLWDSRYHPWNSVNIGPERDLLAGWRQAANAAGLYFGVSIHSSHAWTWYEPAQSSDNYGDKKGIPYDGNTHCNAHATKITVKGDLLSSDKLYNQQHPVSLWTANRLHYDDIWQWYPGTFAPTTEYCRNFFDRTTDMIDRYDPDIVLFDDDFAPLWPVSDYGLRAIAHYYNRSAARNRGTCRVVATAKALSDYQKDCLLWDVERGVPDSIMSKPWQTSTCLGDWHYSEDIYNKGSYKSARTVVHMLIDIVSKRGNLLLNVPMRGDGTLDDKCIAILSDIRHWFRINGNAIYGTRPWKYYSDSDTRASLTNRRGFNENNLDNISDPEIRYVTKADTLYAHIMLPPESDLRSISLNKVTPQNFPVRRVEIIGSDRPAAWTQTSRGLDVEISAGLPHPISFTIKIN